MSFEAPTARIETPSLEGDISGRATRESGRLSGVEVSTYLQKRMREAFLATTMLVAAFANQEHAQAVETGNNAPEATPVSLRSEAPSEAPAFAMTPELRDELHTKVDLMRTSAGILKTRNSLGYGLEAGKKDSPAEAAEHIPSWSDETRRALFERMPAMIHKRQELDPAGTSDEFAEQIVQGLQQVELITAEDYAHRQALKDHAAKGDQEVAVVSDADYSAHPVPEEMPDRMLGEGGRIAYAELWTIADAIAKTRDKAQADYDRVASGVEEYRRLRHEGKGQEALQALEAVKAGEAASNAQSGTALMLKAQQQLIHFTERLQSHDPELASSDKDSHLALANEALHHTEDAIQLKLKASELLAGAVNHAPSAIR